MSAFGNVSPINKNNLYSCRRMNGTITLNLLDIIFWEHNIGNGLHVLFAMNIFENAITQITLKAGYAEKWMVHD